MLAFAQATRATAPLYTWSGDGLSGSGWSAAKNWEAEVAPSAPGPVALNFPRIPACAGVCYESKNDVSELSAESIAIDDGDDYKLSGDALTLGADGLTAAPAAGTNAPAGDVFKLPIDLGASQTWSIAQRDGEPTGENGVALAGAVTGSGDALTVSMSHGPVLYLANNTEVGPLAIDGANMNVTGGLNGLVDLLGAKLNATDREGVGLSHVFAIGSGAVGALTTGDAGLSVGNAEYPAEGIEAASATFDPASEVVFVIAGSQSSARLDYSQLASAGAIALDGARLVVQVEPVSGAGFCPPLNVGQTYTLVSTKGSLSGEFSNAPEGYALQVSLAKSCGSHARRYLSIAYHKSSPVQTVTGTVVEPSEYEQPAGERVGTDPGAIEPLPVNKQAEKEFWEHPPWGKALAPAGGVSLVGGKVFMLKRGRPTSVRLICPGSATCAGKLVLTAKAAFTARDRKRTRTVTIGTVQFSIPAGKTTAVKIRLSVAGRRLLRKDHGRLSVHVAVQDAVSELTKS